jgi:hypothetical protein
VVIAPYVLSDILVCGYYGLATEDSVGQISMRTIRSVSVMSPKKSPCFTCGKHPCKETKDCQLRIDYVKSFGAALMSSIDMDQEYRILPL